MKKIRIILSMIVMLLLMISGTCFASEKTQLPAPEIQRSMIYYNGEVQSPVVKNFDEKLMSIEGNKEIDVGRYQLTITLKDTANYEWEVYNSGNYTYTTEPQVLDWSINLREIEFFTEILDLEYSGKEVSAEKFYHDEEDRALIEFSGDYKAMEIGTYKAVISLKNKDFTTWSDGTTEDKILRWNIKKATCRMPEFRSYQYEYTGKFITFEPSLPYYYYYKDLMLLYQNTGKEVGNYVAIMELKDKEHYEWEIYDEETKKYTYTSENQEVEWKIVKRKIAIPKIAYEYTGKEITAKLNKNIKEYANISGEKGIKPGTYKAIVSLKNTINYEWKVYDKTTNSYTYTSADQEIEWKIIKKQISLPNMSFKYTGEEMRLTLDDYISDMVEVTNSETGVNVGSYSAVLSLKDKENYTWRLLKSDLSEPTDPNSTVIEVVNGDSYYESDRFIETVEDQKIEWKIIQREISIKRSMYYNPSQRKLTIGKYTGKEQGVSFKDFLESESVLYAQKACILVNNKAVNSGTYTAKISLEDSHNCYMAFGDEDITEFELEYTIDKRGLYINSQRRLSTEYTGKEQQFELKDVMYAEDFDKVTVSQGIVKEVGEYIVKISINDKANNAWEFYNKESGEYEYTTDDQELEWEVVIEKGKRTVESVPCILYRYDGNEKRLKDGKFYVVVNSEEGKNVGTYKATISLKDKENSIWKIYDEVTKSDKYTIDDQEIEWEIYKHRSYIYVNSQKKLKRVYNGEMQKITNLEIFDDGYVGRTNEFYEALYNIEGNTGIDAGKYKLKVSVKDDINTELVCAYLQYNSGDKGYYHIDENVDETVVDWEILKYEVEIPTLKSNLEYDGKEKKIHLINFDEKLMTISGNKANEIGKYKAIVSLKDKNNYQWKNGTTDDVIINWSITGKKSSTSGGGSSSSIKTYKTTITQTKGGTITADETEVEKGEKQVFTIVADTGYKIVDVKVDGESVGAVSTYTIENVTKKHTITATFEKLTEEEQGENQETLWVNTFDDVNTNDWYYEAVRFVNESGIFKGINDNTFGADISMNRAMVATVLYRFAGEKKTVNNEMKFNDISGEQYYIDAVVWATENGIVNGVTESEFAPQDNVTREQLVAMLYRYVKTIGSISEESVNLSAYDDNTMISDYAREAFDWAVKNGLITGRTPSTLAPKSFVTRAEVATIMMRFYKIMNVAK